MVPTPESAPHDLYLRASSATKKTPPFKLHANVVGRFSVQRELAPSVGERVRESTNEAISQRANRTTIMIDDPKELLNSKAQPKQKKKKENPAPSSSRTTSLLDKTKSKAVAVASRTTKNPASSGNPLDKLSPERAQDLRRRLIHFLAPEDRSEDEVVRAVGGPNCTPQTRQAVCHVLEEVRVVVTHVTSIFDSISQVGELLGKGSKQYRLKMRTWTEVRPYEWANWSEAIRTKVVRNARGNLKALGIPESDPVWSHFNPPSNGPPSSSSLSAHPRVLSGGRETPEPRRTVSSRDAREKVPPVTKTGRKSEIMAKDESRSRSRGVRDSSPGEMSRVASNSSSSTNAARKQPGSGFKSTPSSKLSNSIDADPPTRKLNDMRPPPVRDAPSTSSQASASKSRAIPRSRGLGDESTHESDNERRLSLHSSKLSQKARVADDYRDSDTERRRQRLPLERERDRERERGRESDRERERDRGRERARESSYSRVKDVKREREEGETSDASVSLSKRKARFQGDDDDFYPSKAAQKRRKTEAVPSSLPPKPRLEDREQHRSSRASDTDSQHRSKVKREASPQPALTNHKRPRSPPPKRPVTTPGTASQAGSSSGNANGSKSIKPKAPLKFRRGSSIYTSSEDEGELPQSTKPRPDQRPALIPKTLPPLPPGPPPLPPSPLNTNGTGRIPSSLRPSRSAPTPYNKDKSRRASLRERYSETYVQYMETMSKLASERNKLEKLVRDYDRMSSGSVTDSEGDVMTHDELAELAARHKQKHQELDTIRREFEVLDSGTGGSSE